MGQAKKILVVDDEPGIREIIRDDLEAEGYEVLTAKSGRTALEILAQHSVSLVVSDVRMPDGDGVYLATELHRRYPDGPYIILITGFSDLSLETAQSLGVKMLLPKPYNIDSLIGTVHKLVDGQQTHIV